MLAPPVAEFELVVGSIDGQEPVADDVRPMIVLCLEGEIRVVGGQGRGDAHPGRLGVRRGHRRPGPAGRARAASRSPAPAAP